jgi:hypothetical protein
LERPGGEHSLSNSLRVQFFYLLFLRGQNGGGCFEDVQKNARDENPTNRANFFQSGISGIWIASKIYKDQKHA